MIGGRGGEEGRCPGEILGIAPARGRNAIEDSLVADRLKTAVLLVAI